MDYEFLRDITGVVKVRMSMGHEVVGHWFNEEVKENLALLDEVEQAASARKLPLRCGKKCARFITGAICQLFNGSGGAPRLRQIYLLLLHEIAVSRHDLQKILNAA